MSLTQRAKDIVEPLQFSQCAHELHASGTSTDGGMHVKFTFGQEIQLPELDEEEFVKGEHIDDFIFQTPVKLFFIVIVV